MQKRDTMHPSSKNLLLAAFFCLICATLVSAQTAQNAPQNQNQQLQPVQDLTPPSDAEAEKLAAAASAAQPASQPGGQPSSDTTKVAVGPGMTTSKEGIYNIRKDVEEVMLYATVVDPHNRMVANLDKNSFAVYEDGQPQQITSFSHSDIPVSLGILVDNSGSMRDKRPKVNQAALNLVRASNPDDEVFIVNFSDDAFLD